MIAFKKSAGPGAEEQQSLLESRNFSLRPLSTQGHLDWWRALKLSLHPIGAFLCPAFVLGLPFIRYDAENLSVALHVIGLVLLVGLPALALLVLLFGIVVTKTHARIRWSAALYWTWWPFWKLVLCVVGAALGTMLGNYLWYSRFYPHYRLQEMQAYQMVNTARVGGLRLQDAGLVTFDATTGVDRARTGCLQNKVTYCVAPILPGGKVLDNADPVPHKQYDLFMAGVDCCGCPGDFRCGDWHLARPPGGLRVVDDRTEFYRLAAEDWSATHGKAIGHPIFFEWVTDPVAAYRHLYDEGLRVLLVALFTVPSACLVLTAILNGILQLLCRANIAAPVDTPLPSHGLAGVLGQHLLPHIYQHQQDQEDHQTNFAPPHSKYAML